MTFNTALFHRIELILVDNKSLILSESFNIISQFPTESYNFLILEFSVSQDYIKDLEDSAFELNEKTAQLKQAEKEKEDIIQLFEDKIREKEEDLERSILEKSELEGKARETEVELSKTRNSNNTLDDVKRNLEQQVWV